MNFGLLALFFLACGILTYAVTTYCKGLTDALKKGFGPVTWWRGLHALVHFVAFFLIEPQWWPLLVATGIAWELVEMGLGGCYTTSASLAKCREWFQEDSVILSASYDVIANSVGLGLGALVGLALDRGRP